MGLKSNINEARSGAQGLQSDLQGVAEAAEQANGAFGGLPGNNRFGENPAGGKFGSGDRFRGRFAQGPTGTRGGSNRSSIIAGGGEGVRRINDGGRGGGIVVIPPPGGTEEVLQRLGPRRSNEVLGGQRAQQDLARVAKGIEELVQGQRGGATLFRAGSR